MAEAKKVTKKAAKEAELIVEAAPTKPKVTKSAETLAEKIEKPAVQPATKAGKRSPKAVRAVEEKQAKEVRKIAPAVDDEGEKAKKPAQPSRSKLERAGKRYKQAAKLIDKSNSYTLAEALNLAVKTSNTKFDASIEMHINLGVDPRQADQNVRDMVVLPAGTGKTIRIAVLADADEAAAAKTAGANLVGEEAIFGKLDKDDIDFDVLIATPAMMAKLGKYARLLGPRGLMPNPKSGTVTQNVADAVKEAKAGRIEYRVDQAGIVHLSIGKASFGPEKLTQNADAVLSSIRAAKPASLKGIYVKSVYVTSTMGPSIKVETAA
jgi:ribosomal protein L1